MRPRERYAHLGPEAFGDVELLGLLLGTGVSARPVEVIAADVLRRHGGLAGVGEATVAELAQVPGVGPARAIRLHAALRLGRRAARQERPLTEAVTSPAEAFAHLGPRLRGLPDEELHALYLDRRRRPRGHRALTRGNDAFTVVDPRQVFRHAVRIGASAVILAHNHPSGDPTPSHQDHDVTRRVASAGRVLGIALLDHLVIAGDAWTSLAERGELPEWAPPATPSIAA